jgi:hypothetical protein
MRTALMPSSRPSDGPEAASQRARRRHSEAERFGGVELDEQEAAISQLPELMLLLPNAATSLEI